MRGSFLVAAGCCAAFFVACVDIFHSTDFATLCSETPADAGCEPDGAVTNPRNDATTSEGGPDIKPIDFCAWSTKEARAQAIRACAWLGACEGTIGENAFGTCAIQAQLAYDCEANPSLRPSGESLNLWTCLAQAKTCDDVDGCVFPSGRSPCGAVPNGSYTACEARSSVLVRCSSPGGGRASGVQPCAMFGKTCVKQDDSAASCAGSAPIGCGTKDCQGTSAVECPEGPLSLDRGVLCTNMGGGTCTPTAAGPTCTPGAQAGPCTDEGSTPSCMGATRVGLCVGGRGVSIACNNLNLECVDATNTSPYDLASACVGRTGVDAPCEDDKCVGTHLHSCLRGPVHDVDCEALGLRGCVSEDGHARCGSSR